MYLVEKENFRMNNSVFPSERYGARLPAEIESAGMECGVRMGYYEKVFWGGLLHKDLCGVKCMRCFEVLCIPLFHYALSYKI